MNKTLLLPALAIAIVGGILFTAPHVLAQNTQARTTLVEAISQKFGLNQSDVKAVFDAEHEKRQTQMLSKFEEQLTQYVTDGKITDAQKKLILEKRKELKGQNLAKERMQDLTPAERKAQMDAKKASLEAWAKENGIDIQYLMPKGFGMKGGR